MSKSICMQNCKSSQIAAYGYDAATKTMAVRFKSGGLYHYTGVPQEVFDKMQASESVGSFLHKHIKGQYEYGRQEEKKEREK